MNTFTYGLTQSFIIELDPLFNFFAQWFPASNYVQRKM
jgi:hypothetical protein